MYDEDMTVVTRLKAWIVGVLIWLVLLVAILATAPGCDWQEQVEEEVDRGVEACETEIRKAIAIAKADAVEGCWLLVSEILIPSINYAIDAQTKTLIGVWSDLCYAPAAEPAGMY